ncbi:MAG: NAD(P)/FAD-dependent oxidoreductase [Flavobacteriia bacterium]|nr:NAD(P)/FAD-dependent oxidoreductase [Flavobacteriia bacterium]
MENYDVIIIGGGPAGYSAAMRAIDFKKKVCLIEKKRIGGAGLFNGALSSKTLWELSEKVNNINETFHTSNKEQFFLPWSQVKKTLNEAIFERKLQYVSHLALLQNEAKQVNFTLLKGEASFIDTHQILIQHPDGNKIIYGENIIIASGSKPRILPNIPVDEKIIMTSNGIEDIEDYPESLVIIGAGIVGCEYATIFSNFGKTKVYIIDRQDRILPFEDKDVSDLISNKMEKKGIHIHHNSNLNNIEIIDSKVVYEILYDDGKKETIKVDKALLAVGRVPNIEELKIENAGVLMSKRGVHIGDDDTRTNIPHIYAVGDVSGRIALVNIAEMEARHAVEKIFENTRQRLNYNNLSSIMFLHPEVATVGLNEQDCVKKNIPVKIVKIDYSLIPRAIAMRKTEGFFKMIVSNDNEMKILGMRVVGEHASSAIQEIAFLIQQNLGIKELSHLIHPHPSIVEGIQECVRMLMKESIFKSTVFKDKMSCYSVINGVKREINKL